MRSIERADWTTAEASIQRYEETIGRISAQLDLGRAAAMRAATAAARGDSTGPLYLAAAEIFEPISPWLHAQMMYEHGSNDGNTAAVAKARVIVEECLDGLPAHLLSEVDAVTWLRDLLT